MPMKNNLILLLLLFLSISIYPQSNAQSNSPIRYYTIQGIVIDSLDNSPIEMAVAAIYNTRTNKLIKGEFTNKDGKFTLNGLSSSSYSIMVTLLGYDTTRITIPQTMLTRSTITLDTIKLKTSDFLLSDVIVTAEPPELVVKEDTLEYNAAAFRVEEGAVVEELIKRLPGIEVDEDGKITKPDGKAVRRVFVDGKEFFGTDPKMATRNLTADIVDKVQVIDKKSDLAILTGVEDDEEETIINITIKKGMKKGWMGNITSGVGVLSQNASDEDIRYTENFMVNRFLENDQISFIANANNINNQGSNDRGNNVRSGRSRGNSGSGITSSNTFGVNTAKIINDKLKFGGNINYNYSDNFAESSSFRQQLLRDSTSYRQNSSSDREYSNNISFNGRLEYLMDTLTTIIVSPNISYNYSISKTNSHQVTMAGDIDSSKVNESLSNNRMRSDGLDASIQVDLSRKLSSKGRRISFSTTLSTSTSTGKGDNISENHYYRRDSMVYLDQRSRSDQNRSSYNFRATYVEPVGNNNFLNFSYNIRFNSTENKRKTLDYEEDTGDYTYLNPDYSKSSETNTINQNIRVNFNSVRPNYTYNIGLNIAPNYTKSKSYIKDWYSSGNDSIVNELPGRTATNYAPQLDFTYRFSQDRMVRKNLRLRYNGRTNQPSVSQLDPTPNNTNPLNIRSGNPDLLPSFNHNISLDYNYYHREKQASLNITANHTFTQNQIINFTEYEESTGIQYTSPINENGSWNSSLNVLFSKPLDSKKRLKFNTNTTSGFSNQIGYTKIQKQSERNVSKTLRLGETVSLSYTLDKFYTMFRGRLNYSKTSNTVSANDNNKQESFNYNFRYEVQYTFPYRWSLSSNITYTANRGLSTGYNKNETIWNAQLSKTLFKHQQGSIRLQVTDILQQRLNIRRTVNANYIEDRETNAMTGYFLLSFTYRFNNISGGNRGRSRDQNSYNSDQGPGSFDRGGGGGYGGGRGGR